MFLQIHCLLDNEYVKNDYNNAHRFYMVMNMVSTDRNLGIRSVKQIDI